MNQDNAKSCMSAGAVIGFLGGAVGGGFAAKAGYTAITASVAGTGGIVLGVFVALNIFGAAVGIGTCVGGVGSCCLGCTLFACKNDGDMADNLENGVAHSAPGYNRI